jgi:hypothetical protein
VQINGALAPETSAASYSELPQRCVPLEIGL